MNYRIDSIQFYVRETEPARFPSALGKAARGGGGERVTSPLCHVHMVLRDAEGNETFGCSADRLSVRWLDKRPGRSKALKLHELVSLIERAGEVYSSPAVFEDPFSHWRQCYPRIMQAGRTAGQEDLTSSYAAALLERAMLDGVCRLAGKSLHEMLANDRLGFEPVKIQPELEGISAASVFSRPPKTHIKIRHTVGVFDPLTDEDWPAEQRLNDGLPETVQDYIEQEGIHYFKVKISGDTDRDLRRLVRLWEIVPSEMQPVITLDANEAFEDLERFANFVQRLQREELGLFQHISFIEQPLPRGLALDQKAARWIREVGQHKPVIIDESDATLDSFKRAFELGYAGTSHKNCKGVFKSFTNLMLTVPFAETGREVILSGEDLQNLPVVPLQQDFVTVGILGLEHCERNGHHYNYGLSMLSEQDKQGVARHHKDLYERRGDEWFLRIDNGAVDCTSLHCPGFGVRDEPDWNSMEKMRTWLDRRYPREAHD